MVSASRKVFRAISVLLVVCMMQVYVLADATRPNVAKNVATTNPALSGLILGRLMTSGNQSILVNGNSANSGTTIISGSQLQTPEGVGATVQLGSAGRLYLQPNTNLTVTFNKESVDVKVAAGNAFVAPSAGVKSTVTTPDGKTSSSVGEPGSTPVAPDWDDWSDGKKAAVIIIPIVIAVIIIVCVLKCGDDDS